MRKNIILLVIIIFFSSCGSFRLFPIKVKPSSEVSSDKVPIHITDAFQSKYPGVTPEKWFLVHNDKYVARFTANGSTTYAVYNSSGMIGEEQIDDPYYDELYDESDDVYDWDWGEMYY
ncbi:MAG: hypothetical protein V1904_05100 [Bacteroidota bacterium]